MRTEPLPIVGVELGARMEDTAISVTERAYVPTGDRFNITRYHRREGCERLEALETVAVEYRVRHLERYSPPVRYKGVAERVAKLVRPWASAWWLWTSRGRAAQSTPSRCGRCGKPASASPGAP